MSDEAFAGSGKQCSFSGSHDFRVSEARFRGLSRARAKGNLVPVWAELAADYETPLSAFRKIHDGRHGFLLESAELTQHSGRYSLLGSAAAADLHGARA